MHGYADNKDALLTRLRRIEGQVRGIQRMIDEDTYCIDVLTQIAAVNSALKKVAIGLLDDHIKHCVAEGLAAGDESADAIVSEATAAIERLLKA
ncbi:MAG: CsoR family transcriptional regulator, copper-sensing transcriptional repressor [Actinomycetota bacterium]|jgi:DNA-binding FrmR family transcriptional regulator|nr:CsoR family transcriptional regulator, copper-sensing transcriptional repressor [Actinomycetota bacterium]